MSRPQALPSMRTTLALVAAGGGAAQDARIRRRQRPVGDRRDHRQRVEPGERVQHLVGRARPAGAPAAPSEPWHVAAQAERRLGQRDHGGEPRHGEPESGAGDEAAGRVHHPQRAVHQPPAQHRRGRARRRPGRRCRRRARPPCSPAAARSTATRRSAGAGAMRAPSERADREPGQAEHVCDQAAAGAEHRRHHHPCDHDQVDCAHGSGYTAREPPRSGGRCARLQAMDFVQLEARPRSAQPAHGGRVQGLERRRRRGQPRRRLSALGDRRRAVRGDRLRALHRLPADAPDRAHGRRRRAPGRVARDRGVRVGRARPADRPRHRAEHALAVVLGRDRRGRAQVPSRSS